MSKQTEIYFVAKYKVEGVEKYASISDCYEYIKDQSTHGELVMEHRKIYESICKHDAKAAMEIMRTHILNQENGILGQLETNKEEKE